MTRFADLQAQVEPWFSDLSRHLYVPFTTRSFRHAKVAWLNCRWLEEFGVDCSSHSERIAIERWLVETFGVSVQSEDDDAEQYTSSEQVLYADRYGAPSGTVHGGSGRVGTHGAFNAKGIGRTPLVSEQSDWYHSHGCMFLEEAIREAVLSEICATIFPYGAVPTVAIIDTGTRLRWRDGTYGARRAIAVRPAFLRIANLMRTIYFGSSGTPESDQVEDAACVRDMWRSVSIDDIQISFRRCGFQYGFGNALRLWPGPFFPSNFTLDGRLVDFGSFRALPNWFKAKGESRAHSFGGERTLVAAAARSLARNAQCCNIDLEISVLVDAFQSGFDEGLSRALRDYGIREGSSLELQLVGVRDRQRQRYADLTGGPEQGVRVGSLAPITQLFRESLLAETERTISLLPSCPEHNTALISEFVSDYVRRTKRALETKFQ